MTTWLEDVITAMYNLGGITRLQDLYNEVRSIRTEPLSRTWQVTIRTTIRAHSSDSATFDGGEDTFYSVRGLGQGVWGLRKRIQSTPIAFDIREPDVPARSPCKNYRILRDNGLARQIKQLHNNQCQLCGMTIDLLNGVKYSEAHHIKPLGSPHNGPDVASNIIVLCPNCHVMSDYGAIHLKLVDIKQHPNHRIEEEYINYHNRDIYNKTPSLLI
jgi:hypothetical protein